MNTNHLFENEYYTGIYIRLSQEDRGKKYEIDSESVSNQRKILTGYVIKNKLNLVEEYIDDGYSGTDFDRPGFKRLLEDINKKKINCVVVKDLSRFGRDHVMTGYYIETFFPENRIRFISILESFDSYKNQASNDSSTFIIACNDYYSKQNSIKIRNVLNEKRRNGKYIASLPLFGYMRDPNDKGHLLPNPETAPIVKKIFKWRASGIGPTEIANRLNNEGVSTPAGYKGTKYSSRLIDRDHWNISTVRKILTNRIYTGDMIQHTQTKINYKSKKRISLDESLWDIVENTHDPLVSKKKFNYIQVLIKRNSRNYKIKTDRKKRILEGKLYCSECGNRLSICYRSKKNLWEINCNRYSRDPARRRCKSHFYNYDKLEKQVLNQIDDDILKKIKEIDIENFIKNVKKKLISDTNHVDKAIKNLELEEQKLKERLSILYIDRCDGIITPNIYKELAYELELKILKINKQIIEKKKNFSFDPDYTYTTKILELLDLKKMKKKLYDYVIDKIIVDEKRCISIIYKYNVIPEKIFTYNEVGSRNS